MFNCHSFQHLIGNQAPWLAPTAPTWGNFPPQASEVLVCLLQLGMKGRPWSLQNKGWLPPGTVATVVMMPFWSGAGHSRWQGSRGKTLEIGKGMELTDVAEPKQLFF